MISGRRFPALLPLALLGLIGVPGEAQAQLPTDRAAQVALVYDDQRMSDADRAALLALVARLVPPESWQTIAVPAATDLRQLVNKYDDYYQLQAFRAPLTAAAAVEALQDANDLDSLAVAAGSTLRLPPFPVRAFGTFPAERAFRLFNAEAHAYAIRQNADLVSVPEDPIVGDVADALVRRQRAATATGIVLPASAALAAAIAAGELPRSVIPFSVVSTTDAGFVIGTVSVELLDEGIAECAPARGLIESSRFYAPQQERVRRVLATRRSQLLTLAAATPLVLIDVGFGAHHGFKVRRVAEEVLRVLGAADLRPYIKDIELYPVDASAAAALNDALTGYLAATYAPAEAVAGEFARRVDHARTWITASLSTAAFTGPRLDIPEVLLQAVFWKQLSRGGWVNMSFRMQAPAMAGLMPAFARGAVAFGVAAVGNSVQAIRSGWLPQDVSTAHPNFINVTYGTELGELRAEYTSGQDDGARVPLLAPGCGFDGVGEGGSSLASPYVAAASWLRALLDAAESGASIATTDTWRNLLAATRPIPGLKHSVESGGMFDAAMLIAPPAAPHYLMRTDGAVVPLASFRLDAVCAMDDGGRFEQPFTSAPAEFLSESRTFAVHRSEAGTFLWRRQVPLREYARARSELFCRLADIAFTALPVDGPAITYRPGQMAQFIADIAAVTW